MVKMTSMVEDHIVTSQLVSIISIYKSLRKEWTLNKKIMKKYLLALVVVFSSVLSVVAVPSGMYYPSGRNGNKVLVDDSGKTLYVLDKEGNVLGEWTVIEETNKDGGTYFVLKSKFGAVKKPNGWWIEGGKVYMNLQGQPNTLVKE